MPHYFIIKGENVNYIEYDKRTQRVILQDCEWKPLDYIRMSEKEWNAEYKKLTPNEQLLKAEELYRRINI